MRVQVLVNNGIPPLDAYFDYAATAPEFPEALEAASIAALTWFGNPSSPHGPGQAARAELERLKKRFAELCGFMDGVLVLTSGATEANNLAIHGAMSASARDRVLVAPDVHASVWNACQRYLNRVDTLPLDPDGRITLSSVAGTLRDDTRLVCVSHGANETGVIQDVAAISALCERRGILCLVDGTQALGRVPVDLSGMSCDFYVFGAHKFGGPRGCGGLFLRSHELKPIMDGGSQERGIRPGTENLAALAGAVKALQISVSCLATESERLRNLTRIILEGLEWGNVSFEINGNPETGLPGVLSLCFPDIEGHAMAIDLSLQGFAVSSGSACTEDRPKPSRAIMALGRSVEAGLGTLRISCGRTNTDQAARALGEALVQTVKRLRRGKG